MIFWIPMFFLIDIFPVGWSHPRFDFWQSFGLGDIRKPLPQEDETWTTSSDRRKIQSSPSEKVVLLYDMNFGGLLSYLFMYLCIYFIHISLVSCFMCFSFYFKLWLFDSLLGCRFCSIVGPPIFHLRVASSRPWVLFAWIFSRLATQKNPAIWQKKMIGLSGRMIFRWFLVIIHIQGYIFF